MIPLRRLFSFTELEGELKMSLINTEIKPFKTTAFHNGKFGPVSDADLKGKWSVVVFYPADFTFVCPTELGDLADEYESFKKIGVEVYAVSTDTHFTHKAWHDASETIKKIRYPMLGDPTGTITRNFDVMIEEEGLALRGTFVINPKASSRSAKSTTSVSVVTPRNCCARFRLPSTSPATLGEVCPAKWTPGDATLAPSLDLVGKI
jgi:peroxiredoxin